jgi:MFS family permease
MPDESPRRAGRSVNRGNANQAERPVGYLELVRRNADFRNLWTGQIVSLLGDWFNLIASAALVSMLTGSGLAVGGLFVVRMLAPFLVSPVAGVIADRFDRRRVLILTDLSRAAVVLGFLLVRQPGQVWFLYALTATQLGISGIFYPARNAILPDVVGDDELGAANALSGVTWSVMLAFGAALGGLAAGLWGIYPSFLLDSSSFFISAFFVSRVRTKAVPMEAASMGNPIRSAIDQYVEGLRYLRGRLDILAVASQKGTIGLVVNGGFQVAMVVMAEKIFVIGEGGSTSLGLMYAVVGIGTGLGPVLARRMTQDRVDLLRTALMLSFFVTAAGVAVVAPLASFYLVLAGSLVRGLGSGVNWVLSTQVLLLLVPGRVRGRVFSVEFAIFTLSTALSSAGAGWLLDRTSVSVQSLLVIMGVATLFPGLLWAIGLRLVRGKEEYRTPMDVSGRDAMGPEGPDPLALESSASERE